MVTTATPSAASVGARMRDESGLGPRDRREHQAATSAQRDREREPDAEQPQRQPDVAFGLSELHGRGVGEEDQGQRELGEERTDSALRLAGSTSR